MSAKRPTEHYVCRECGYESLQWLGKCPSCASWNSFGVLREPVTLAGRAAGTSVEAVTVAQALTSPVDGLPTGNAELDRVLGGGLTPGSVSLLAGEPGIGKSTLLLTLAATQAAQGSVIYVSGEETAGQIARRATRLGLPTANLQLVATQSLDAASATVQALAPRLVIIDSVQTVGLQSLPNPLGSVVQIREVALELGRIARELSVPIVLVGHVTKDGDVAGPKLLEHLVDAVLVLEGERTHDLRLLRTVKNRFGPTDEVGVFEMGERGLIPVPNPSARFLDGRASDVPGSAAVATLEGTRAILVELQALAQPTSFGYPKRTASGFDVNRLQLLLAVLEQRAKIPASRYDVYLNVVGGVKLKEPAVDLGVCLAVASAIKQRPIPKDLVVWGEVGLSGEIRSVSAKERRADEARRCGFRFSTDAHDIATFLTIAFASKRATA